MDTLQAENDVPSPDNHLDSLDIANFPVSFDLSTNTEKDPPSELQLQKRYTNNAETALKRRHQKGTVTLST